VTSAIVGFESQDLHAVLCMAVAGRCEISQLSAAAAIRIEAGPA